jgi:hypothetical protein
MFRYSTNIRATLSLVVVKGYVIKTLALNQCGVFCRDKACLVRHQDLRLLYNTHPVLIVLCVMPLSFRFSLSTQYSALSFPFVPLWLCAASLRDGVLVLRYALYPFSLRLCVALFSFCIFCTCPLSHRDGSPPCCRCNCVDSVALLVLPAAQNLHSGGTSRVSASHFGGCCAISARFWRLSIGAI